MQCEVRLESVDVQFRRVRKLMQNRTKEWTPVRLRLLVATINAFCRFLSARQ